mgnify:CR=1 FL=1
MVKSFINIFLIITFTTFAQSNQIIKQKNSELEGLKTQITNLENKLELKKTDEVQTIKSLDEINHQTHLLQKVIKQLNSEESKLATQIEKLSKQIENILLEINSLKKESSEYVKWLYINRTESKWDFLIKSKTVQQALMRYKYFSYITSQNEEKLDNLVSKKAELEILTNTIKNKKDSKIKLEREKLADIEKLNIRKDEKNNLIAKLEKEKSNIEKEINEKRKYEIEIKARIAKLIEEERERERKIREARFKNKSVNPTVPRINYAKFENFKELKGKMSWPLYSKKIVRAFGENKNKKLKTITLNYGIDIKAKSEEKVFAVAEGVVSVIDWIVGFGSIIIVTHKGDFRTVYGHIDNIQVSEGDIVKAGTELGTVNKSLEGDILHFEVWDERNYQNPQEWLVKK